MIDELKLTSQDMNRFRRNVPVREMDGMYLVADTPVPEPLKVTDPRSELDMFMFISLLAQEVERADAKHGSWRDADLNFMTDKIRSEVSEVLDAVDRGDLNGEHGMKAELIQVACTAYKMWRAL